MAKAYLCAIIHVQKKDLYESDSTCVTSVFAVLKNDGTLYFANCRNSKSEVGICVLKHLSNYSVKGKSTACCV